MKIGIIKTWAWMTDGKPVWLRDFDGEVTLTIARETPFGERVAKRWWPFGHGMVKLLDGGVTSGLSYVKDWKDAE